LVLLRLIAPEWLVGKKIRIDRAPPFPAAYAAVSAR